MAETRDSLAYYKSKAMSNSKDIRWVSGYHGKLAAISEKGRKQWCLMIKRNLQLEKTDLLLDVGCGAGFMTIPLLPYVKTIICLDALPSMLDRITKKRNTVIKICAMADRIPLLNNSIDKILCNSVFQYFPDYSYAERVLREMYRVCRFNGQILIVDLPDVHKKVQYEALLSKEKTARRHLRRLFYEKVFFSKMYAEAKIFDQRVEGYLNSPFRFNALMKKKPHMPILE